VEVVGEGWLLPFSFHLLPAIAGSQAKNLLSFIRRGFSSHHIFHLRFVGQAINNGALKK